MLIQLPYPSRRKSTHIGFIGLLSLLISIGFLFSFKRANGSKAGVAVLYPTLSDASSGEVSVLTYNVAGLPQLLSSAETPRASSIREIGRQMNQFDLINVQEDFNYNRQLYSDNQHPYRTESMGAVPFGDGLSTLSRFPIMASERVAWEDCSGADCLTPKGFSYHRIQIAREVFIDVYNVHATAQDNQEAVQARRKNLDQLADYIKQKSAGEALLIMGDFNAHYAFSEDNLREFQQATSVSDSWVLLRNEGRLPECLQQFQAIHALQVRDDLESIDKIYFRNSDELSFRPKDYRVEHELFRNADGKPLSDHCAISMKMEWTVR